MHVIYNQGDYKRLASRSNSHAGHILVCISNALIRIPENVGLLFSNQGCKREGSRTRKQRGCDGDDDVSSSPHLHPSLRFPLLVPYSSHHVHIRVGHP